MVRGGGLHTDLDFGTYLIGNGWIEGWVELVGALVGLDIGNGV